MRILVLSLALVVTALAASPPPELLTVRRSYMSTDAAQWPDYVARAEGLYEQEGLTVEEDLVDARTTVSGLIGGSFDIAFGDATAFVLAASRGANLVAVGWGMDRIPYSLMASPNIKSISQLKGQKVVAAGPLETYTTVLRQILRKGGIDPDKDVEFVYAGSQNQRIAALLANAVQAGLVAMPATQLLQSKGYNSLAFVPNIYHDLTLSVTLVRRDWAQEHSEALKRYLRAQASAIAWLYAPAHREQAVAILADATKTTPAVAQQVYDYFIGHHVFPRNACVSKQGMENLLAIMHETGRTKLTPAETGKVTDPQWCP